MSNVLITSSNGQVVWAFIEGAEAMTYTELQCAAMRVLKRAGLQLTNWMATLRD